MAWGRWGVLRPSTRGWGTPEDAAGGSSVSPEAQASARKNLNAGTGQAGRGPQVQPRCQASRRVSSCLQVGEHGSQACSSEHWRGSRPPASSGLPAPADTGPGHLPPTSAGPADERGRWGTGPECGVSSLPAPAGPSSRTQTSRLFSSSLAGALNRPLPSSWGGGLSPGGLHSRQAAGLAVRVTPLSAPLEHHRHLSWALGPESRSPRTSARTSQTLDRAQRPEKDRRSGLGGVHSESPFYCLQALFYKSTLRTSPPAHHSHKVSPQTLDPSPPRHSLLVPHLDYEGILAGSELSLPLATQGRGLRRTPHGFLG